MHTTRRTLLAFVPALAGCAASANGTLDVARIAADGAAAVAALRAVLATPAVTVLLGANAPVAAAGLALAQAAAAALATASRAIAVDTARVQGLATALIGDAQSVIAAVQAALADAPGEAVATITDTLATAQALLPLVALAASVALPVSGRG